MLNLFMATNQHGLCDLERLLWVLDSPCFILRMKKLILRSSSMRHCPKYLGICHLQVKILRHQRGAQSNGVQHTGLPLKAFSRQYHKTQPQQKLEQMSWYQKDRAQIQPLQLWLETITSLSNPKSNTLSQKSLYYSLTRYVQPSLTTVLTQKFSFFENRPSKASAQIQAYNN